MHLSKDDILEIKNRAREIGLMVSGGSAGMAEAGA
jgi:hypothetical protein